MSRTWSQPIGSSIPRTRDAAPSQRVPERAGGLGGVAVCEGRTAGGDEPGEAVGVDLIRRYNQPVT
ncbi:hypothetical protein AB0B89_28900 [Sphaerisporangium sp. NPDC049002]|uniref:hypothetical protein n=1 Tax=Sphaerisporangium sp. NPDC049002 TaxID=3155392 RepID=UPI003404B227